MIRWTRRLSSALPTTVTLRLKQARLALQLQRERFGRQQRLTNSMISVPGLDRCPTRPGSVWGVCLARNEQDIVGHAVRHMLDQGVDGVIVVDNLSTDDTFAVLTALAAADPRVHVGIDRQVGFHQGGKISFLSHLAWRAGADWIVPFDADELWFAESGDVASFLAEQSADSAWCDYRNVFPTPEEGAIDLDRGGPVQVERGENAWLRVCFRARRWVWVGEGNHALRNTTTLPVRGLHMLHYSYRSLEQYSRKVDHGVTALTAAGKDDSIATHWRRWSAMPADERRTLWNAYLSGDESILAADPISSTERVIVDAPHRWKSWDPTRVLA